MSEPCQESDRTIPARLQACVRVTEQVVDAGSASSASNGAGSASNDPDAEENEPRELPVPAPAPYHAQHEYAERSNEERKKGAAWRMTSFERPNIERATNVKGVQYAVTQKQDGFWTTYAALPPGAGAIRRRAVREKFSLDPGRCRIRFSDRLPLDAIKGYVCLKPITAEQIAADPVVYRDHVPIEKHEEAGTYKPPRSPVESPSAAGKRRRADNEESASKRKRDDDDDVPASSSTQPQKQPLIISEEQAVEMTEILKIREGDVIGCFPSAVNDVFKTCCKHKEEVSKWTPSDVQWVIGYVEADRVEASIRHFTSYHNVKRGLAMLLDSRGFFKLMNREVGVLASCTTESLTWGISYMRCYTVGDELHMYVLIERGKDNVARIDL